jgi:hypothetical protein
MILDTRSYIVMPVNVGGFNVGDLLTLELTQLATGEAPLNQDELAVITLIVGYSNARYTLITCPPIAELANNFAEGMYRWKVKNDNADTVDKGILKLINNTDVIFNSIKRYQSATTNDTALTTVFYSETL